MISVIITSFKEPATIGRAIQAFLNQKPKNEKYEIIVVAPDNETIAVAKKYKKQGVKTIKDPGKGKPTALNLAFKQAKGEILILSDGDVYASGNAIQELTKHFKDEKVGGAAARVVSINNESAMFGFWASLLSHGFHYSRQQDSKSGKNVLCSGYLYAIRKKIAPKLPPEILADDAFVSLSINKQGYKTVYEPKAEVYVKYPDNLPDWIKQKKRTAARFYQLNKFFKISKLDSFAEEMFSGARALRIVNTPKEMIWFLLLIPMRFYLWFRVFFDIRLWKRAFAKTWQRVPSTK